MMRVVMMKYNSFHLITQMGISVINPAKSGFTMLLITLYTSTFKPWQANFERLMIKFADVMNKMVNDEKITQRVLSHQGVSINPSQWPVCMMIVPTWMKK